MVNCNFGTSLIMTIHSCGARAKLRVNLLRELNKLRQFSRSETENAEFPISG